MSPPAPGAAGPPEPPPPHDDDRCARLYELCKLPCLAFARRLLAPSSGRNRHLCAFDAEEFYDLAWETYYHRREYLADLADRDEHVRRLNALIFSRISDERRRAGARKREALNQAGGLDLAEHAAADDRVDEQVIHRDEVRSLLAQVRNPGDARALYHHEVEGRTFEEIGAREGITAEAARRRALRAKQQARAGREAEQ